MMRYLRHSLIAQTTCRSFTKVAVLRFTNILLVPPSVTHLYRIERKSCEESIFYYLMFLYKLSCAALKGQTQLYDISKCDLKNVPHLRRKLNLRQRTHHLPHRSALQNMAIFWQEADGTQIRFGMSYRSTLC